MSSPDPRLGWLGTPPEATWPSAATRLAADTNPFVAFRHLLWSHHRAMAAGWSDVQFVDLVRRLDDAVVEVDGRGFRFTPLVRQRTLAEAVGQTGGIWAKDETSNVSGTHKARHLFGLALHLAVDEVPVDTPLAISSCGNAALAAAVVARACGRPLAVHVPTWADSVVLDRLHSLGAEVRTCERRAGEEGDPCILRFRELVAEGAVPFTVQGTEAPWTLDGCRTLGYELMAGLADHTASPTRLFVQVGGATMASSIVHALADAVELGAVTDRPSLVAVQAEGCAPLARAFDRVAGADDVAAALCEPDGVHMWPWENPGSAATGILDDMAYDWRAVVADMLLGQVPGGPVVAAEADIVEAHDLVRTHTNVPADPTGTAGMAGLLAARRDGCVDADEEVVVLFTGVQRS